MTKQEVEQMLTALEGIAECIGALSTDIADIAGRLNDLCECIGQSGGPAGTRYKYFRVIDLDRE